MLGYVWGYDRVVAHERMQTCIVVSLQGMEALRLAY